MAETRILDYSFSHPTPAQIKGSGAVGVARYLSRSKPPKTLTAEERAGLHAAGLSVALVFEDGAGRAKAGRAAGASDAAFAAAQAASLKVPAGVVIFFAVDFDTTAAAVAEYFQGVASVHSAYVPGIYGSLQVVDGTLAAGLVGWGWQTVAWSGGKLSAKAHLYQRNHFVGPAVAGCDENVLLKPFPMWQAHQPAAASSPQAAAVSIPAQVSHAATAAPVAPAWPLPPDHYFGTARPSPLCHSGQLSAPDRASILIWQQRMAARGWRINVDGHFTPQSAGVVNGFKKQLGFPQNGLLGNVAWAKAWSAPVT